MAGSGRLRKPGAIVAATAAFISVGGLLAVTEGVASAAPTVSPITFFPPGAAAPQVGQGGTGTVPDLAVTVQGAAAGDNLVINIAPNGQTNNPTDPTRQVSFGPAPSVFDSLGPNGNTGPRFAEILQTNPGDPQGVTAQDELILHVLSPATDGSAYTVYVGASPPNLAPPLTTPSGTVPGSVPITVNAASQAALGAITTIGVYVPAGGNYQLLTTPSLATVGTGQIIANNPSIAIPDSGATNYPISNVTFTETAPGQLGAGATSLAPATVTLALTAPVGGTVQTLQFDPSSHPTVTVSGGTGAGIGAASVSGGTVQFKIYAPSTLAPASYTFSGLAIDAIPTANALLPDGPIVGTLSSAQTPPFAPQSFVVAGISATPPAIAGADADGTAIAALDARFPHTGGIGTCVPNGAVVLARDDSFQDALSASFLAQYLHTGILLTPSGSLAAETANELKLQGVSTVYIVGGPLAITPAVQSAIQSLPVYACGGASTVSQNTNVATVVVAGANADGTSAAVAEYPKSLPTSDYLNLSAAFAHASNYNDTTGAGSSTPPGIAENTAIIASDQNFPDAMAASALSYADGIPIIITNPAYLSTEAQGALTDLGIQQVVLVGGPLAVSDTVEASLASTTSGMGLSVLRVAGQDATDTAVKLASFETNTAALGINPPSGAHPYVFIARGDFYTDALAASSVVGGPTVRQPLLLTETPSTLGPYLTSYLNSAGAAGATSVIPFGGPVAVNPSTISAANSAIAAR